MAPLTEDDQFRASTQFRLWSYTADKLAGLRAQTNVLAAQRVRRALGQAGAAGAADGVDCLTVADEEKLLVYYCAQCLEVGKLFDFPINVTATAIQYLKRFYLTNSPMTYHPKQIMPAALFLATKTENYHIYLRDYAARLSSNPKRPVTAEDVLAPEFLLTQALRFTFDVRHPHRGLKGAYMELLSLADGSAVPAPAQDDASAHPFDAPALRDAMHRLPLPLPPPRAAGAAEEQMTDGEQTTGGKTDGKMKQDTGEATGDATGEDTGENAGEKSGKNTTQNGKGRAAPVQHAALVRRLEAAYGRASDTLKSAAVLSDAYFRYTPAQIWLAALLLADEPVAAFYLDTKLAPPLHAKVLGTLRRCAALLDATAASPVDRDRDELVRIDKKLYRCRNPDKVDLVGLNRVQKRDGAADGDVSGSAVKKRKLEREKQEKEGDDLFGPSLSQ